MHTTVNFSDFTRAFHDYGRADNFSYAGLRALFDYLEDYEDSCGEPLELDVIALCCDYTEAHWEDIASDYSIDLEGLDDDEKIAAVRDHLEYNTCIVGEAADGVFVYGSF